MVSVNVSRPRRSIAVHDNVIAASYAFNNDRVVVVQVADASPAEVIDIMIQNGSSGFGRQALSAVALATSCFEDKVVGGFVHEALTRRGAILAFDRESRGLMVLDPNHDRLFLSGAMSGELGKKFGRIATSSARDEQTWPRLGMHNPCTARAQGVHRIFGKIP